MAFKRNSTISIMALLIGALVLSSCSAVRRTEQGPCPGAAILYDAERVTVLAGDQDAGAGAIVYQGQISDIALACRYNGKRRPISVQVDLTFDLKVPGGVQGDYVLPYFVAVMRGKETILAREEFQVSLRTDETGAASVTERVDRIRIPLAEGTTGAAYQVIAGLRLTPDQVAYNRRGRPIPSTSD